MRPSQLQRFFKTAALAATVAVAGAAFPVPAMAQVPGDTGMARTTTTDVDDDGMDWGWVGLLGLAGLLGLRRRADQGVDTMRRP